MRIPLQRAEQFKKIVWAYYQTHKRNLAWRKNITPYRIFVSEIMLQQTQASRVERFYPLFLKRFPHWRALDKASLRQVMATWHGMGYNRRALMLKKAARAIMSRYGGILPKDFETLKKLPGVGNATAGAICAYAYNQPVAFIETNIRRVFIHHFFKRRTNVSDKNILPLVGKTVDTKRPRAWYWALMDYGSWLARAVPNPNRKSASYKKQPVFKGSMRQLRGKIIDLLLRHPLSSTQIKDLMKIPAKRVSAVLKQMEKETLIRKDKRSKKYTIG